MQTPDSRIAPTAVTIPPAEREPELAEKLKAEWSGILAWAIAGCLEWQRIGLAPPSAVLNATNSYLADEDALGRFLDDRCAAGTLDDMVEVRDLFSSWKEWAEAAGEFVGSDKRFSQQMDGRGYRRCKQPVTRRSCFQGIRLLVPATPDVGG